MLFLLHRWIFCVKLAPFSCSFFKTGCCPEYKWMHCDWDDSLLKTFPFQCLLGIFCCHNFTWRFVLSSPLPVLKSSWGQSAIKLPMSWTDLAGIIDYVRGANRMTIELRPYNMAGLMDLTENVWGKLLLPLPYKKECIIVKVHVRPFGLAALPRTTNWLQWRTLKRQNSRTLSVTQQGKLNL